MKGRWLARLMVLGSVFAAGCGASEKSADREAEQPKPNSEAPAAEPVQTKPEPVTLTFYSAQGKVLEQFGAAERLKAKFPHITLEVINSEPGKRYTDLIAAGILPDIIFEANSLMRSTIIAYDFHYDLDELIKKNKYDLNRFEANILAQAKHSNSEGKLYGLPYSVNRYATVYNKDLFDKFGVPYPKDGLTWDDVYALAQRLTREDGGQVYQGFMMNTPGNYFLNNQLSLDPLHPTEDRANVNTDGFKLLFENLKRFYEIPNTKLTGVSFTNGDLAIMVGAVSTTQIAQFEAMNWDMVAVPTFKEKPSTGFKPAGLSMFITKTSKHKDAAFQIIEYLVSDEFQTILARNGGGTTLASEEIRRQAGLDVPSLKGKNVQALYYYQHAPTPPARANHLTNVTVNFGNAFNKMIENQTDVNTVLRTLEEEINKAIAEQKAR